MERASEFSRVIAVFATYGFRKASMGDLAEAAGVSRQTLYNRFDDKQAVLDWSVEGIAASAEARAIAALDDDGDTVQRLTGFFVEWLGRSVPIVRGLPHGAEIFDMATASLRANGDETQSPAWRRLVAFLGEAGLAPSQDLAEEGAYLLILASKGLMLKVSDVEAYSAGMTRISRYFVGAAGASADNADT